MRNTIGLLFFGVVMLFGAALLLLYLSLVNGWNW